MKLLARHPEKLTLKNFFVKKCFDGLLHFKTEKVQVFKLKRPCLKGRKWTLLVHLTIIPQEEDIKRSQVKLKWTEI
jgi:hypothetical protein